MFMISLLLLCLLRQQAVLLSVPLGTLSFCLDVSIYYVFNLPHCPIRVCCAIAFQVVI